MNSLTAQRQALAALLEAGMVAGEQFVSYGFPVTVVDYMPERPQPPLVIVAPGSPYLVPGQTFGTFITRFTLIVLTRTGPNEVVTADLDDLVATVVVTVAASDDFDVVEVSTPASFSANGATYLGATVDVTTTAPVDDGRED
jgi:hypothetical protein